VGGRKKAEVIRSANPAGRRQNRDTEEEQDQQEINAEDYVRNIGSGHAGEEL